MYKSLVALAIIGATSVRPRLKQHRQRRRRRTRRGCKANPRNCQAADRKEAGLRADR